MDAKQLTSGLFEVDLGVISADRYQRALRTLSSSIDDKELLDLLKIQIDDAQAAPGIVRGAPEPIGAPAALAQAGAK